MRETPALFSRHLIKLHIDSLCHLSDLLKALESLRKRKENIFHKLITVHFYSFTLVVDKNFKKTQAAKHVIIQGYTVVPTRKAHFNVYCQNKRQTSSE